MNDIVFLFLHRSKLYLLCQFAFTAHTWRSFSLKSRLWIIYRKKCELRMDYLLLYYGVCTFFFLASDKSIKLRQLFGSDVWKQVPHPNYYFFSLCVWTGNMMIAFLRYECEILFVTVVQNFLKKNPDFIKLRTLNN